MAYDSRQQLGNYRIIRLLGTGGFAEVYLGQHIYLKTPAAIKLLLTKVAGQGDMEGFLKEAQTIARLAHPNIVRVMDFGVENETPYLVMDYAPNGTLRNLHPKGSIVPLPAIVFYVKQVAEALQYAHDEKLIHRDVKPENMLIGQRKQILLSDFGIALVAQSSRYQSTQDVIGTVAYMSPEQIQGKPGRASDQYSLGIVVYEWLSGDRPFHGSFIELCTQHMFATPAPLREKMPTIPSSVEQVVTTALAKDPGKRFPSVQAFALALEQAAQYGATSTFVRPALRPQIPPPVTTQPQPEQTILPVAPMQPVVTPPFPQPGVPSYHNSYINQGSPGTGSSFSQPPAVKQHANNTPTVNAWPIIQRQVVATLLSIGLGLALTLVIALLNQNQTASHTPQILVSSFALLALIATIPPLSGAIFGRWVGCFTGGLGTLAFYVLLYVYAYAYIFGKPLSSTEPLRFWPVYLGFALVGFITGSKTLAKGGRYPIKIGHTLRLSSGGSLVGAAFFTFSTVSSQTGHNLSTGSLIGISILTFVGYALIYIIVNSIVLPLPLAIYNSLAGLKRPSR